MAIKARFLKAADNSRPFKSHRYDVYGLKIERTVTLFGRAPLNAWIVLEADPTVTSYCERPILVQDCRPRRVVDYWVQRGTREELWIIQRSSELGELDDPRRHIPAFCTWADAQNLVVKLVDPAEFEAKAVFLDNWGRIIRELSANRRFLMPNLVKEVESETRMPLSLSALVQCFQNEDPVLIRTAAFALLHNGRLRCKTIDTSPLGPGTVVEAS